ncbi:ABC transporter ATP-binding protein [Puniceicoccales bacterium CK1056]|uniref:ABC transporter ATP-binding protein n=1 Tax=Oceanipulchritudo coccoides TaxID=2706888 RepID=A0A6B2LYA4_9BACT|nr:ABC transporter ATP-binding protein [Oceanipulchritudo coccoides]NDV61333.1 ABC transporter ATP-binding protein [Oceanipulchritudo coccoides]
MFENIPEVKDGEVRPLLECQEIQLGYSTPSGWKPVVNRVDFEVRKGETVALVGESGSGKSTIAKALVKLIPLRGGSIRFDGKEVGNLSPVEFQPYRKKIQMIFQDPLKALNPRLKVSQLIEEPLRLHFPKLDRAKRVDELLQAVQLPVSSKDRFPSEFSGGQRQRILIARALAVEPELLVCDEPVSALDVTIQARLLELLESLKSSHGLTLLFISHDLAVVQQIADRVLVLQNGRRVEWKETGQLFKNPEHPYTRMLIDACPTW